jgi:hypothetical protein
MEIEPVYAIHVYSTSRELLEAFFPIVIVKSERGFILSRFDAVRLDLN